MDIRAIHEQNRRDLVAEQRHTDNQMANVQLQETVVKSFASLVGYLDRKVSKTEVVNQLREIGTPDALKVVASVENLHETIRNKPEVDLSEIVALLRDSLEQVKLIPKEQVELPDSPEIPDYSDSFKRLEDTISSVKSAIEAQKTTVEAPVVNVPETVVNVPETDLKPIERGLEKVEKSVKALVFPTTDTSKLEKEQVKQTKLLKEIRDKPVGGSSGGGSSWPAVNAEGVVQPLTVDADGKLIVSDMPSETTQLDNQVLLNEISTAIQSVAQAKGIAADLRVTILGGGVTISSGTVTTVTTVNTVTNMNQMAGLGLAPLYQSQVNSSAYIGNINNVART